METERYGGPQTVNELAIGVCVTHASLCASVQSLF